MNSAFLNSTQGTAPSTSSSKAVLNALCVIEIDGDEQHDYGQHDINFLTAFANVLAEAVDTSARMRSLLIAIEEKDRLLD